jgi:hypothetical protein
MLVDVANALDAAGIHGGSAGSGGARKHPMAVALQEHPVSGGDLAALGAWLLDRLAAVKRVRAAFVATVERTQERWRLAFTRLHEQVSEREEEIERLQRQLDAAWAASGGAPRPLTLEDLAASAASARRPSSGGAASQGRVSAWSGAEPSGLHARTGFRGAQSQ